MSATLSPLFTWRTALCRSDLPANTRHVGMVLSLHMSEMGDSCFPGIRLIAQECGRSLSTVTKAIGELEGKGWLGVKRGGGRAKPNRYTAIIPENVTEAVTLQNEAVNVTAVVTEDVLLRGRQEDQELDLATPSQTRTPRDALWDALTSVFGEAGTRSAKALRGKIVSSLLEAGATPSQVLAAKTAYQERMPGGTTFTETALEKHWGLLWVPVENVKPPSREKYGRRDVSAKEMFELAERLEAERLAEERKALAP